MAYSLDGGKTFEKYIENPVVSDLGGDARDPKVIRDKKRKQWIMSLYSGDKTGTFLLLKSENLREWNMFQEFSFSEGRECPDFFPLKVEGENTEKWVFLEANGIYLIGSFDGDKFQPEQEPVKSFAGKGQGFCYAGQTWSDIRDGKRIYITWQKGDCGASNFNQSMTVPVEFTLRRFSDEIRLYAQPVPELKNIREQSWFYKSLDAFCTDVIPAGDCWDISFDVEDNRDFHLKVCEYHFGYDASSNVVKLGDSEALLQKNEKIKHCRILVDRASTEIFINEGAFWIMKRVLVKASSPLEAAENNIDLSQNSIKNIKIYQLKSIFG
jgi:sucrose-6-phosphate hydrolase SacC (GH32 family)